MNAIFDINMKSIRLKLLFLALYMFIGISVASAYDFCVNGIYYNKNADNASVSVTYLYAQEYNHDTYTGNITIPSSVTYNGKTYSVTGIGWGAFSYCQQLTSVNIPNTVTSIGGESFEMCIRLTSAQIPNSVTIIGKEAFYYCGLTGSLIIPSSVTTIEEKAFYGCGGLTGSLTIPNSVTTISKEAFYGCSGLTSVSIGDAVTEIGTRAFYGCTGLTSVSIGDAVTSISRESFLNCPNITNLTIGKSVSSIGQMAFYNSTNISRLVWNARDCSYYGDLSTSTVENLILGEEVEKIPESFVPGSRINSVIIPNSVTYIGKKAFYNCSYLKNVTIGKSVSTIGENAFGASSGLTNLSWYAINCSSNGNMITSSINHVDIGDEVKILPENFLNGSYIQNVVIPNSVTNIGKNSFKNCINLYNVVLGNSVNTIGDGAFSQCSNLMNLSIPNSVTAIREGAFSGCSKLTEFIIPQSVGLIGQYAFYGCTGLNYVVMLSTTPPSGSYSMFQSGQLIYVPNESNYKSTSYWNAYNIQGFYSIEPQITRATILSNNQNLFTLKQAKLMGSDGQVIKTFSPINNSITITDMIPNTYNNITVSVVFRNDQVEVDDQIKTQKLSFTQFSSTLSTQTTLNPTFSINRDEGFILDACGVESSTDVYYGSIKEATNDGYIIESKITGLTPNCGYSFRPWVQYKGVKYYGDYSTFYTSAIEVNNNATITPTSIYATSNYSSSGDAVVTNAYFTFNGERYESLYQTGLNPNSYYDYTYTIETTSGNQVSNDYFYTPSLSMVAQPVRMLTNTTVLFEAQTNMIDEETMVGFEWRRYDAPDEMPSTKVYSPVFGGKIAGTLKNLAENVYYKYRPFYTSNSGKSYYGNWVAFLTADAGVVYEPMVYTYNSPEVKQTEATLQGVALRGSDEITEQGFEYWKSGNGNIIKVQATGERMSKKVNGLQSGAKYTFRAFLKSGGVTRYGNEVEFVTLSNSLDVNGDGEVNILDVDCIIGVILNDHNDPACDVNGDGEVNILDVDVVINIILGQNQGGAADTGVYRQWSVVQDGGR